MIRKQILKFIFKGEIMSNCPSCQSSNTKKMAMVWAGGSRTGQSRSTGIGVSSRGTIGIGASRGRSSSQSHLAAACAPPQKSSLAKIVAAILFVMFWIPAFSGIVTGKQIGRAHV